jgi:hypothetical protein
VVEAFALRVPKLLVTVRVNRLLLMFWLIWFSEYRLREDSPALRLTATASARDCLMADSIRDRAWSSRSGCGGC